MKVMFHHVIHKGKAVMRSLFEEIWGNTGSKREQTLSNQVDQLEFELQKAKREIEALKLQKSDVQQQFSEHRLRDYPAAGSLINDISTPDLFKPDFQNPIEYVLEDVQSLGYDVSAAWMVLRAMLDLSKQHFDGVKKIKKMADEVSSSRAELVN